MNLNRKKMHPQLGERLPQFILQSRELHLGLGYIPACVEHSQAAHPICHDTVAAIPCRENFGLSVSKKANAQSADTTVDKRASNINYSQKENLCTAHCNTDHKQVLGLSAVQQLEEKTHLVNHQNVNRDRKPEFNSGHGFYNEFMGGKMKINKARHLLLL